ncbi:IS110 family transposase [Dactylosporangium cerinum]
MPSVLAERLADRVDAIVGVDTHTDTHTAAVLSPVGSVLAELTIPATADGIAVLLAWARDHTDGLGSGRRAWALDSARSHGVGLLRALRTAGETVFEAPKPTATARRRGGKSDSWTPSTPPEPSWPPRTPPRHAPTATAKPCGFCMPAAATTPTPAPPRSTCSSR